MSQILISFVLSSNFFFCVVVATGQKKPDNPDLSGTWVMQEQSDNWKKVSLELSELTLVITEQEPEIRITRRFMFKNKRQEQHLIFYSDGRGEENLTYRGEAKAKSKTRWKGPRLIVSYGDNSGSVAGPPLASHREVNWQIVEGGSVLIERDITTYRSINAADASVSARDLDKSGSIPAAVILERVYKKMP